MTETSSGSGTQRSSRYVDTAYVENLLARASRRDLAIVETVWQVRVASGAQLERLHFHPLSNQTRARTRRLVLARLAAWGLLAPLQRTIGGVRGGSSGLVFALDRAGQRLVRLRHPDLFESDSRARRPWTPGRMFLSHSLAVSELYVSLIESSRTEGFLVEAYLAEPRSWWPNGIGGWLKPDAYLKLAEGEIIDHWWIEVDRATESLPTLRAKLATYLDFMAQGQLGPQGIMPRVLITVPDERRRTAVAELLQRLPDPASQLFVVTLVLGATEMFVANLKAI
jgi:protein involved in plasmid replication-relaxation